MKAKTEIIIKALRILAVDIQSQDGVANAAIAEAADRMQEMLSVMSELVSFDDQMNDETWEECGTYAGAYYAYYKGSEKNEVWEKARAIVSAAPTGAEHLDK